ncbi:hypothetical protein RM51_17595 [Chryseobacterium taiwanense]|uniref:Uncharacterized protein n=1 Tax=Chryseobacterium taiwanense TaxID=363331 RepID=A0A0B4E487_9FLAO|nr:hypothetical protein RM51_17595 [Chryseobacterium taiwanense]
MIIKIYFILKVVAPHKSQKEGSYERRYYLFAKNLINSNSGITVYLIIKRIIYNFPSSAKDI